MSFSAEMKGFISAYQAGQKVNASRTSQDYEAAQMDALQKKTAKENTPEALEMEDKLQQLKLQGLQRGLASGSLRDQLVQQRMRQEKALFDERNNAPSSGVLPTTPAVGTTGPTLQAAPQAQGGGLTQSGTDTLTDPGLGYAEGGAVPTGDDETTEATPDDETTEPGAVPTSTATDFSSRGRTRGIDGIIAPQVVNDAVLAAKQYGAPRYGLTNRGGAVGGRTPSQAMLARAYVQGHGGLTDDEMNQAKEAVDPQHKLTDAQRNMAALGSVWQFWNNKGDPEKAGRVAFQMLQHYRNASQRYAAIAAHANDQGNTSLAAQAAVRAYQNVPDGKDMTVEPNPDGGYMVHLTGPKGEDIVRKIVSPQELGAAVTGLASGGFDKALLTAAGEAEQQQGAGKGGAVKPVSAADRLNQEKLAQPHVDQFVKDWDEKSAKEGKTDEEKAPINAEHKAELSSTTQRILQSNPGLPGSDAVRAAHKLMMPGGADPEKLDFKVIKPKPGEEGDPTVDFGKFQIKMPQRDLDNFANSQAARIKAETEKINKKMEASDKADEPSEALEGAKQVGRGALRLGGEAGEALGTMGRIAGGAVRGAIPDELYERGKSLIKNTAGDIERGTRAPASAIPLDPEDRPL